MEPVERKKTVAELYTELEHANLMRRQADGVSHFKSIGSWHITYWRNEVGRLTQEIRRAQMLAGNNKGEN